jgi:hypothetical protein
VTARLGIVVLLALGCGLALEEPSQAAPAGSGDMRELMARRECQAGRTERGLAILAELYAQTRDSNHLYNQARCLQQNGRPAEAAGRFRDYLRVTGDLTLAELADVQQQIAACERMQGASGPAKQATTAQGMTSPAMAPPAETPPPGRRLRRSGLASGVTGLAVIGLGVGLGLRGRAIEREERQRFDDTQTSSSRYQSGERLEQLSWISYATGAAAVGTGAVLYFLGARARHEPTVALLPTIGPGGGGGVLRFRF